MTGLIRGLLSGAAAAIVALAARYGLHLDQETVAIGLTAAVGTVATWGLHLAERRWPVVPRIVGTGQRFVLGEKVDGPPVEPAP